MKIQSCLLVVSALCFLSACVKTETRSPEEESAPPSKVSPVPTQPQKPLTPPPVEASETVAVRISSPGQSTSVKSPELTSLRRWCYQTLERSSRNGLLNSSFDVTIVTPVTELRSMYSPLQAKPEERTVYAACEQIADQVTSTNILTRDVVPSVRGYLSANSKIFSSFYYYGFDTEAIRRECMSDDRMSRFDSRSSLSQYSLQLKTERGMSVVHLGFARPSNESLCDAVVSELMLADPRPATRPASVATPIPAPTPSPDDIDPYFEKVCEAQTSNYSQVECLKDTVDMKMKSSEVAETCLVQTSAYSRMECMKDNRDLTVAHPAIAEVCRKQSSPYSQMECLKDFKDIKSLKPGLIKACLKNQNAYTAKECLLEAR
jgi:hypothetical protein